MHRFSRTHLSPADTLRTLEAIYAEENSRVAEVIALIAVIDARGDPSASPHAGDRVRAAGRRGAPQQAGDPPASRCALTAGCRRDERRG
jgi:hypothetical protein